VLVNSGKAAMDTDPRSSWPVMVLAHNEERHIVACLDSIFAEGAVVMLQA
jgi:hypothetical protein